MSEIENTMETQPTTETVETTVVEEKVEAGSVSAEKASAIENENEPEAVIEPPAEAPIVEAEEQQSTEEPVEASVEQPLEEPVEDPIEEPIEESTEEPAEPTAEESVEPPVEQTVVEEVIVNEPNVNNNNNNDNEIVNTTTEQPVRVILQEPEQIPDEELEEEKPKEKFDDSVPLIEEADKNLLIRSNSNPSQIASLEEEENIDYTTLSKEELIEKVNFLKDQCKIIKEETDKKIKNTNDYIVRLEEATEQRLERLRKQNQDDIDEIKQFSDQLIKNEKEKAETYVKNMKKSVDEERDVLRQIENDSRSRYQKEKEEKNEALVEINRLKSIINSLHNDVEDREEKIQKMEENNLNVFVQKDKELEQAIIQIENERKHSRVVNEENIILREKLNEVRDELNQFKNESEIRNSQINLLNEDNQQMHKKVANLTRKNEELTNLYEFKLDEAASLKTEIERLKKQIEHLKRKKMNRINGISPLTPNHALTTPISASFQDYSIISTTSNGESKSMTSQQKILEGLDRKASTSEILSDVSLSYDQSTSTPTIKEEDEEVVMEPVLKGIDEVDEEKAEKEANSSVVNNDGIVTMNNISPGAATQVETVEGPATNDEMKLNVPGQPKPEQRTLVIDTHMTINNSGGDPAFNYQEGLPSMIDDELDEDEEDTIMGSMLKPLVFHTNDQTFINFSQTLKENYDRIYNTKLVKQCELEEIVQCLDLSGAYMGFFSKRKLLSGLKNNIVVIEKTNPDRFKALMLQDIEPECALCTHKYNTQDTSMNWYQFFYEDEKNCPREIICMFCRERLVTICNWYKYLSMIANRIIKHDVETIYINCLQLKENMYHARNGLTTDDNDNGVLNVVNTGSRPEIVTQRPGVVTVADFSDIDIDVMNGQKSGEIIKKASFDNSIGSADSATLKNTSEIMDGVPTAMSNTNDSKKRPSLCYNNTIQKKLSQ